MTTIQTTASSQVGHHQISNSQESMLSSFESFNELFVVDFNATEPADKLFKIVHGSERSPVGHELTAVGGRAKLSTEQLQDSQTLLDNLMCTAGTGNREK